MKKLIPLMIGLCLTFGTVVAFAQADPPKKEETTKKKSKKGSKKKEDTTKKQG